MTESVSVYVPMVKWVLDPSSITPRKNLRYLDFGVIA